MWATHCRNCLDHGHCAVGRPKPHQVEASLQMMWWMKWLRTSWPSFHPTLTRRLHCASTPPRTSRAWTPCWCRRWCASTASSSPCALPWITSARPSRYGSLIPTHLGRLLCNLIPSWSAGEVSIVECAAARWIFWERHWRGVLMSFFEA